MPNLIVNRIRPTTLACVLAATALLAPMAYAQQDTPPDATPSERTTSQDLLPSGVQPLPSSAEDFRIDFDRMLQEHTYLAAATTENLVAGRREEYLVSEGMLQSNSVALAREI